jgi:hypothetical protein
MRRKSAAYHEGHEEHEGQKKNFFFPFNLRVLREHCGEKEWMGLALLERSWL